MAIFYVSDYDVATGAVVDTYKTLLGLKAANTTGHRGRVRSLSVGGAGQAAQDIQVALRLIRMNNAGDGTSTAITPAKRDANSLASIMTGGANYTVEPTTAEDVAVWEGAINARGSLIKEWMPGEGPEWGPNLTMCLQATPGITTAVTLTVHVEWEEF